MGLCSLPAVVTQSNGRVEIVRVADKNEHMKLRPYADIGHLLISLSPKG